MVAIQGIGSFSAADFESHLQAAKSIYEQSAADVRSSRQLMFQSIFQSIEAGQMAQRLGVAREELGLRTQELGLAQRRMDLVGKSVQSELDLAKQTIESRKLSLEDQRFESEAKKAYAEALASGPQGFKASREMALDRMPAQYQTSDFAAETRKRIMLEKRGEIDIAMGGLGVEAGTFELGEAREAAPAQRQLLGQKVTAGEFDISEAYGTRSMRRRGQEAATRTAEAGAVRAETSGRRMDEAAAAEAELGLHEKMSTSKTRMELVGKTLEEATLRLRDLRTTVADNEFMSPTRRQAAMLAVDKLMLEVEGSRDDIMFNRDAAPLKLQALQKSLDQIGLAVETGTFQLGEAKAVAPEGRAQARLKTRQLEGEVGLDELTQPWKIRGMRTQVEAGEFGLGEERAMAADKRKKAAAEATGEEARADILKVQAERMKEPGKNAKQFSEDVSFLITDADLEKMGMNRDEVEALSRLEATGLAKEGKPMPTPNAFAKGLVSGELGFRGVVEKGKEQESIKETAVYDQAKADIESESGTFFGLIDTKMQDFLEGQIRQTQWSTTVDDAVSKLDLAVSATARAQRIELSPTAKKRIIRKFIEPRLREAVRFLDADLDQEGLAVAPPRRPDEPEPSETSRGLSSRNVNLRKLRQLMQEYDVRIVK